MSSPLSDGCAERRLADNSRCSSIVNIQMNIAFRIAALLLFVLPSVAQAIIVCSFPPSLELTPGAPLPTEDVKLTVFDSYLVLGGSQTPRDVVVSRNGSIIAVHATLNIPMPSDGPPFTVDLGVLPEGRYTVEYRSDPPSLPGTGPTPPVTGCPAHEKSLSFSVSVSGVVTVVEYYNAELDHYFITSAIDEIGKLDSGAIRGWVKTGESFRAYAAASMPSTANPVCRLYAPPSVGVDSHFFSDDRNECEAVKKRWPDVWFEESPNVFGTIQTFGQCGNAADQPYQQVHRLYNNRPDANHRYVVSLSVRDQMLAKGWMEEGRYGDGTNHVAFAMCVPK
jgi:hypothetical protein